MKQQLPHKPIKLYCDNVLAAEGFLVGGAFEGIFHKRMDDHILNRIESAIDNGEQSATVCSYVYTWELES